MMDLSPAPFFSDVAQGPDDVTALWAVTPDGTRVRVATWAPDAAEGTVFLFPGRTEYVEKYAPAAGDLAARGLATIAIDWRGQGLADRLLDDPLVGHVGRFRDYQKDVAAMLRVAHAQNLPKPWYLLGHSMGGCIALRSLYEDLPVQAVAFTGPMWGILISPAMRPAAWVLGHVMPWIGRGGDVVAGSRVDPYVLSDPFEDNMLTRDPDMYEMMRQQISEHSGLALGGPSYQWLREAMAECRALARMPAPRTPCVTFLGTNERIVDADPIHARMGTWSNGRLEMVEAGEHEVMMEGPATRARVFDAISAHFLGA